MRISTTIIFLWLFSIAAFANGYRFADRNPVSWSDTPPASYPVHGVDVSRYQGVIDWPAVKGAGIAFAYIKATEGADHYDPYFASQWQLAQSAGVPVGAYHFYHFCTAPEMQAQSFISVVPRVSGMLPPALDLEWNSHSNCQRRPSAHQIQEEVSRYVNIIEMHYGQAPIIYTNKEFYYHAELYRFRRAEFWLRSTNMTLAQAFPAGQRWLFWQYTGSGVVPGVNGQVDINAFAGSAENWQGWLRGRMIR